MRLRSWLAALLVLAAVPSAPIPARADEQQGREQARKLFEEGLELEKKSDYKGALSKYREAERLAVTAGLRFHKGYCLEMTGSLAAALDEYEAADKLARDQNKQEVRSATAARLEPLRGRVPQLSLRLVTTGVVAEVQLDGAAVATPLLEGKPFRVDPGDHKLTARASGFRPYARSVHVPETALTTIEISLERDAPPVAAAAAPVPRESTPANDGATSSSASALDEPPREASSSRSLVLPIATTAGALGLVGAGVAFFAVAGGTASNADIECTRKVTCEDEQSRVRTFDALALGSFIGAAALGTIAVVLWASPGPKASATSATPAARLVATPSAIGLAGSF